MTIRGFLFSLYLIRTEIIHFHMKAASVIVLLCFLSVFHSTGQQVPQNSQYMFSIFSFNPGQTGSTEAMSATLRHRQQWIGMEGAPLSTEAHLDMPVRLWGSQSGAGLTLSKDEAGFNRDINIMGTYAYHVPVGKGLLGLGLSAGIVHRALSAQWYIPESGSGAGATNDPSIPQGDESKAAMDINIGAYYQTVKYFIGISSTHLNKPSFSIASVTDQLARHYYITAGYTWQLNHPSWQIMPSVLWCSNGVTSSLTGNILAMYNKKLWAGVSYRRSDAVTCLIGLNLASGLRIGYSHDFTISGLGKEAGGSHEFLVNYRFRIERERSTNKYKSIRYL